MKNKEFNPHSPDCKINDTTEQREKYRTGFFNVLTDKPASLYQYGRTGDEIVKYNVVNICQSSNGKVVAFARDSEIAEMIVNALNLKKSTNSG